MTSTYGRATIAAGQSLSNAVDVGDGSSHIGLIMPASWTAAAITFQAAVAMPNGGVSAFGNLYDDAGNEVTLAAANLAPNRAIAISTFMIASGLQPWRYIKIRSGTLTAPVVQVAACVIQVVAET